MDKYSFIINPLLGAALGRVGFAAGEWVVFGEIMSTPKRDIELFKLGITRKYELVSYAVPAVALSALPMIHALDIPWYYSMFVPFFAGAAWSIYFYSLSDLWKKNIK